MHPDFYPNRLWNLITNAWSSMGINYALKANYK